MLTIGEFSRICSVSKKTLRHYDEVGLLRPEHIADNGYRYYESSQLRTMLLISRLKSYGFSLAEIGAVLESPAPELLAEKLAEKQQLLQDNLQQTQHVLRQIAQDIEFAVPVPPGTPEAKNYCGGLHCFTTLTGPYAPDEFTAAYAALVQWIDENGYRIVSAPYDRYVQRGPSSRRSKMSRRSISPSPKHKRTAATRVAAAFLYI